MTEASSPSGLQSALGLIRLFLSLHPSLSVFPCANTIYESHWIREASQKVNAKFHQGAAYLRLDWLVEATDAPITSRTTRCLPLFRFVAFLRASVAQSRKKKRKEERECKQKRKEIRRKKLRRGRKVRFDLCLQGDSCLSSVFTCL